MTEHAYILTLSCPDRLGLVHTVSGFLLEQSANIEEAAQYNDQATGLFFMRVQFACAAHDLASLKAAFAALAEPLQMHQHLRHVDRAGPDGPDIVGAEHLARLR